MEGDTLPGQETSIFEPLKILVLDDETEIVNLVKRLLKLRGHSVRGETDPDLALRALAQETYDVVLLDLLMPKANGLSLISEILKLQPKTAIVVVSALVDPHLAAVATQEGGMACLAKPINWTDLERIVQSVQHQRTPLHAPVECMKHG